MLKNAFLILAVQFSLPCLSQDSCSGRVPDPEYLQEIAMFFQQVGKEEFRTDSIDLREKVDMSQFVVLLEDYGWKTSLLTTEEIAQLKVLVKNPPLECWEKSLVSKASLLIKDSHRKSDANGKLRNGYYSLSVPLFFRDFTICLVSMGYHCGALCGRGHLSIYKKINGSWRKVEELLNWVS